MAAVLLRRDPRSLLRPGVLIWGWSSGSGIRIWIGIGIRIGMGVGVGVRIRIQIGIPPIALPGRFGKG